MNKIILELAKYLYKLKDIDAKDKTILLSEDLTLKTVDEKGKLIELSDGEYELNDGTFIKCENGLKVELTVEETEEEKTVELTVEETEEETEEKTVELTVEETEEPLQEMVSLTKFEYDELNAKIVNLTTEIETLKKEPVNKINNIQLNDNEKSDEKIKGVDKYFRHLKK